MSEFPCEAAAPAFDNAMPSSIQSDVDCGVRDFTATRPPNSSIGSLRLGPRKPVFQEGERCTKLYEIVEGLVLTSRTLPDGRRQVLEMFGPDMLLGLPLVHVHALTAETVTDARLRLHTRRSFEQSERLQQQASAQLQASFMALSELAIMLGRKTAAERLAGFLLKLARIVDGPAGSLPAEGPLELTLALTQADIADHLGLSIETVCRELAKMKGAGLIALNRKGWLRIADVAVLAETAEQSFPPSTHRPAQERKHGLHRARVEALADGEAA